MAIQNFAEKIDQASDEQTLGISNVADAMRSLEVNTRQNQDAAIYTDNISQSLTAHAQSLEVTLGELRQLIEGDQETQSKTKAA